MLIKHGNNALSNVTAFPSAVPTGKPVLLSTATASSSSSIEFTSGIDSTYDIYQFEFVNIASNTNAVQFQINFSTDSGSNYNVTKTTTQLDAAHNESDTFTVLRYRDSNDLAQSTSDQIITPILPANSGEEDSCANGTVNLFAPSSSVFVKHFLIESTSTGDGGSLYAWQMNTAGYCNTQSTINAVRFKMDSGNIDAGTIKMYGISA